MDRSRRILIFSMILALLSLGGMLTLATLTRQQEAEPDLFSATALPADHWWLTQTAYKTSVPSLTPLPPPSTTIGSLVACGWQWATQINEELSAELQEGMAERLPEGIAFEVYAESVGENCLNPDGSIRSFSAMQTDFRITIGIDDPAATDAVHLLHEPLSLLARDLLAVLAEYPPDETPGPQSGLISINFEALRSPGQTVHWLSASYDVAVEMLNQNVTGSAFFEALGGLRRSDRCPACFDNPTPTR